MIRDKIKKIVLIYEGVKAEANLFENINQNFFDHKADIRIVVLPASGNIYMLWSKLKADDFQTDLISVLKEMNSGITEKLKDMAADDFSEVYLFFDYDGHNNNIPKEFRGIDVLAEMLETFNNETELGKLYISYPMVESIKEISVCRRDYKTFHLPLEDCARYKQIVGGKSDYCDYKNITKEMWYSACDASRKRASLIVSYKDQCSYHDFLRKVTQENIYNAQKNSFIKENKAIGILNSIPLFLIEYYDEDFWNLICGEE